MIEALSEWHLAEPIGLLALIFLPVPWLATRARRRIAWPTLVGFRDAPRARAGIVRHLPNLFAAAAIVCLAVALARPRAVGGQTRIAGRGVAIVVAIDRSASMAAADFPSEPGPSTRLDAAKETLSRFVQGRPDDLVGAIAFADVPRRISPPTLDHDFVLDAVRAIRPARSGEGGTNLGHAIALGLGDLRGMTSPKKVLILLTDGRDAPSASATAAPIAPEEAAALAARLGITLHTIAVGGAAGPPKGDSPVADQGPDVDGLKRLAALGGGRAFAAADGATLGEVFAEINALERSPMVATIRTRYREGYPVLIAAALGFLMVERFLRFGPLRRLP